MHIRRMLTGLVLAAAAPLAFASSRPTIIVNGDPPRPTPITGDTFGFGADALGGGVLSFVNDTGTRFFDLSVFVTLPELTPITCGPGPFGSCTVVTTVVQGTSNYAYDIVLGPTAAGGITAGEQFSINLNDQNGVMMNDDPNGPGSWGANRDFTANANTAPEPASWLLILTGLAGAAGVVLYRRRASAV